MTAERPRPALVCLLAPAEVDASALVVALTTTLRSRGVRVGTASPRASLAGEAATVLVTGSGARVTLPGVLPPGVLRLRAAALDPALDLLLVERARGADRMPTIEVLAPGARPTPGVALIGSVTASQLADAGPSDDFGLAGVIEERVLARHAAPGQLAEATQAPIESQRRLLDRSESPPVSRPPSSRRATPRWRRWLGL